MWPAREESLVACASCREIRPRLCVFSACFVTRRVSLVVGSHMRPCVAVNILASVGSFMWRHRRTARRQSCQSTNKFSVGSHRYDPRSLVEIHTIKSAWRLSAFGVTGPRARLG
ncbi:hypothetical protein B0J17DRAFT_677780 [Rhizoctonia solani]|nr:hypothetical protein B0J17DRAFT_677780 [Rhizoctonia solani]